jgi:hypothetical protein
MTSILMKQGNFFPVPCCKFSSLLSFLVLLIFCSLPKSNAHSARISLSWDPNTAPNIAGYKLYYGPTSGSYLAAVDAGNKTTCTILNLPEGNIYYFAATDYDASGNESNFSNEVEYQIPADCTDSIFPTSQSFEASGGSASVNVITAGACSWTAITNAAWLIITSNNTGTGNGTVNYSVAVNQSAGPRSSTMTIAGKTFTITQSASALTINAGAGNHGSLSPSGSVAVSYGGSQRFTILPEKGYQLAALYVNGVNVGRPRTYLFGNVMSNQTIYARFTPIRLRS